MIVRKAQKDERDLILKVLEPWNMHHVPSPEMEELDLSCFYVAVEKGRIIGVSGFKMLDSGDGKTTLLGVLPEFGGKGIGKILQDKRLFEMHARGAKKVITNADRPATIKWYKKNYGYYEIGKLEKIASFGDDSIEHWTTLEMDLVKYVGEKKAASKLKYAEKNQPPPLSPYRPLLINACPTGMIPTKQMTEHVPITPEEIAEQSVQLFDAGARIVHLHARDENGKPTWKAKIYETIISNIKKERPEMICCISTSGRNWPELEKRSEALHITGIGKPDMASLTLGSLNFPTGPSINSIEMISSLARIMMDKGIKPEMEVFDPGMISLAKILESKGLIEGTKYFNLLLGSMNSIEGSAKGLDFLTSILPENSIWAATGIGMFQLPINMTAITMGGNVRVGLEDNIFYDYDKKRLATNLELVKRITRIASELMRPIATPEEARQMIGI